MLRVYEKIELPTKEYGINKSSCKAHLNVPSGRFFDFKNHFFQERLNLFALCLLDEFVGDQIRYDFGRCVFVNVEFEIDVLPDAWKKDLRLHISSTTGNAQANFYANSH